MTRYNWDELWPQVQDLLAENKNIKQIAEMLEIDVQVLRCKIDREKRKKERQKRIVAEEKQAKPRPSTDELQRLWDKYDGKINPIAKELGVSWAQVRQWLIDAGITTSSSGLISGLKQQAQKPEPVQVGSQEPVQAEAGPAGEDILSQVNELRYDLNLERKKVAQLERQIAELKQWCECGCLQAELKQKNLMLWSDAATERLKNNAIPIMAQLIVAVAKILEAGQDV